MSDYHSLLADYRVILEIPLLWGDQDAFGHINNLAYLRWSENARVDYFYRIAQWPELPPKEVGPILASMKCDYKTPLNYPDTVIVGTRVSRIGNSSIRMEHRIVSKNLDALAADVDSTLVMLDYRCHKPVTVSAELREAIGAAEGRRFEMPELAGQVK